jgi:hypothetical protein
MNLYGIAPTLGILPGISRFRGTEFFPCQISGVANLPELVGHDASDRGGGGAYSELFIVDQLDYSGFHTARKSSPQ